MRTNCQHKVLNHPVCVIGLGLIGGSLMRALAAAEVPVFGWNRSEATVEAAHADGFDVYNDLPETLLRAAEEDALIVLGVPVYAVAELLSVIVEYAPQCALTDVVSVKEEVQALVEAAGLGDRFVGSHPMAGNEYSGWQSTDSRLFEGAPWVVMADGDPEVTERVQCMAVTVGAHIVETDPVTHDGAVACISHVPHLVASALATTGVEESIGGGDLALQLAAGSFRDGTRVAGTSPSLVRSMCEGNRRAVLPVLGHMIEELQACYRELWSEGTVADLTARGNAAHAHYKEVKRHTDEPTEPAD
ncbi:MAG TPA: prephenate dehydrogenase [Corynebacteriales bacterium]|nr:prephenate dehydrogenase [Mycobacteriales bacterium]